MFLKLFKVFINKFKTKILSFFAIKLGWNVAKPDSIYYLVSNKCNFKCQMCPQWKEGQTENVQDYLSEQRVKELIDELKKWGVKNFGISGGETMIYKDKVLELLKYANEQGLYTHFVTNGSLLDEKTVRKYDSIGGGHISMSVDAIGKRHDELRGFVGAFAGVQRALDIFKKVKPKHILLKINLVLSDKNLDDVLKVLDLAREHNSSLFIQPFDPYNWDNRKTLPLDGYRQNYPLWVQEKNIPKLKKLMKELMEIKKKEPSLIINSFAHLKAMADYFILNINRPKCWFAFRSISITPNGSITLCRYGLVGNIKNSSIKELWDSDKYRKVRKHSSKCDFDCMLGCMYDPSIFSWIRSGIDLLIKRRKLI